MVFLLSDITGFLLADYGVSTGGSPGVSPSRNAGVSEILRVLHVMIMQISVVDLASLFTDPDPS